MRLEGRLGSISLISAAPWLRAGAQISWRSGEDWLWSLGIDPGEVSGKRGSKEHRASYPIFLNLAVYNRISLLHTLFFFFFGSIISYIFPASFAIPPSFPLPSQFMLPSSFPPTLFLALLVSGWAVGDVILFHLACFLMFVLGEYWESFQLAICLLSLIQSHFTYPSADLFKIVYLPAL